MDLRPNVHREYEISELLRCVRELLELCEDLRIRTKGRFEVYSRVLEEVAAVEPSTQRWRSELSMACFEILQLVGMVEFLRSHPPELVRSKLDNALRGSTHTIDETTSSNQARNALAELWLASKLWRAGLDPRLGEPDISCTVAGRRLLFEVKRPFSPAGVEAAIQDAEKQLVRHLKASRSGTRGIVFVSLSKILHRYNFAGAFHKMEQLGTELRDDLRAAEQRTERIWHSHGNDVIGIAFHAAVPAFDLERKAFAFGECIDWISLACEHSVDGLLMRLVAATVGESA